MELYQAILNHFYDQSPDKIELYGVGTNKYNEHNEKIFKEIEQSLEKDVETEYHPISLTGAEGKEIQKMDMYRKERYKKNSILMVPQASGFYSETANVAKRYRKFLGLTEDSELDGVIFLDVEKDMERWRGYNSSKLVDDIMKQEEKYPDLLEIEWQEKLLLGNLKNI